MTLNNDFSYSRYHRHLPEFDAFESFLRKLLITEDWSKGPVGVKAFGLCYIMTRQECENLANGIHDYLRTSPFETQKDSQLKRKVLKCLTDQN